jgi:hypothetical protein
LTILIKFLTNPFFTFFIGKNMNFSKLTSFLYIA